MQLNVGVRAKYAPPANHFATRKLESTEPHQLLLNHIAQLLDCSQASKLSISGPLLHVVQAHLHVPYWQAYFLLGGTICFQVRRFWQVGTTMRNEQLHFLELVLFQRFNSCWLCASYLPHRSQLNTAFLLPFLLYFLPVSTFATPCRLSRACCRYVFSTASCYSYLASGRGSPMMVWVVGYAICW